MEGTQGTIEAMKKDRKGFKLSDGEWYSNSFKDELIVNKGDEVKITYKLNGTYRNYETVEVVKKSVKQEYDRKEERINVDAGNIVQRATELVIQDKAETLEEATNAVIKAFEIAQNALRGIKPEEVKIINKPTPQQEYEQDYNDVEVVKK